MVVVELVEDLVIKLIIKPCQARKTPEIQTLIEENPSDFHIVVSDNFCAQVTKQVASQAPFFQPVTASCLL